MSSVTPMMQQYLDVKEQYKDCILFFRIGDFYEMFYRDAETASRELEITLTGKDCGLSERAPMCGIPFHAADSYISRLIGKGHKVAICEQVEDPALAKGLVKREVIRVVTPGTVTDAAMLDERKNNYLMSIYRSGYCFGISAVDISTGDFFTTRITWGNTSGKLIDEVAKYSPSELIVNSELVKDSQFMSCINMRFSVCITPFPDEYFQDAFCIDKINSRFDKCTLTEKDGEYSLNSSGALLEYLEQTQKVNLNHIREINNYRIEEYMVLDVSSRRNLELTENMREKTRKNTLLWVLDKASTSMGSRLLRKWIEQPLLNVVEINERLGAVEELKDKFMVRQELRELLKKVYDMERLLSKVILGNANCRDLIALKNSSGQLPYIKNALENCSADLFKRNIERLDCLEDIYQLIENAIAEDPPVTIKEGGIIKTGYNSEVDRLRSASTEGKDWVAALECSEKEKTGIKSLKVGFNRVFGYYIEVTKSYYSMVPETYIRKQTLANCERYITQELKEMEDTILGAEEKVIALEYDLFLGIRDIVAAAAGRIKNSSRCISEIDAICSLSEVADRENYCKPDVNLDDIIDIKDGRHPVVEKMMDQSTFVPNDTLLDMDENMLAIITGPNMAGKSTYMRQTALIVLMAQMGSFVPASSAVIGISDRIFTRVGASDDLASGQSTFMVEMSEVANILNNATNRSLLILDEIGRGTSTFDGLSIAWAVIEYIGDKERIGARTLFATHYHELTDLEGKITGIKNYRISVKEKGEDIIFLRKILRGGADDSYGIQVARLAGLPQAVIDRAKDILKELDDADISKKEIRIRKNKLPAEGQLDLFSFNNMSKNREEVINDLKSIEVQNLTPLEALNTLYKLQQKLKN